METESKNILTKAAVARRQLDAAIRIWLADEDILAVYTVAAAAYGVLRGIMDGAGKPPSAHFAAIGMFQYAKQVLGAKTYDCLPAEFGDAERDMIQSIAERISSGEISCADDITYTWDKKAENKRWAAFNAPANYLKHADRDLNEILRAESIDVDEILFRACGTYVFIFKYSSPEMMVFGLYSQAVGTEPIDGPNAQFVEDIRNRPPKERKSACLALLRKIKSTCA